MTVSERRQPMALANLISVAPLSERRHADPPPSATASHRHREAAMSASAVPTRPGLFHGWLVVAAAFAVTFVGFGSAYTFSAFVGSLQQDFAASRGSVSLVFSLAGFLYFGLGIVSGPLADRWGSRRVAVIGMILTGVGLAV